MPTKVVDKVFGGHGQEPEHPAFEAAIIGVDVVDMIVSKLGLGQHALDVDAAFLADGSLERDF